VEDEDQSMSSNDIPEGDGSHNDQPSDIQPESFQWNVPEELQTQPGDDLDTQAEKLQQAVEQREQARQEYEQQEQEKSEAREQWNNEAREAAEEAEREQQQQQEAQEQERKEAQAEAEEQFEEFEQLKRQIELPADAHPVLQDLLDVVMIGQEAFLQGPAGTGKSYLTEQVASILGWDYFSISYGPQTPESRLWGYPNAEGHYVSTPFREWYDVDSDASEKGRLFCGDEVDNGHPGIITTKNQALAGAGVTFPDGWVDRHPNARMVTTANTWGMGATAEFMGRNPLDTAFLNRFTKLHVPTDESLEEFLVTTKSRLNTTEVNNWLEIVHTLRKNAEQYKIRCAVSMRDAIAGAQLKSIGWSTTKVLDTRVLAGLPEGRREHMLAGTGIR